MPWTLACATSDIDAEDLIRWDHAGQTFAIYHSPEGTSTPPPAFVPMKTCISAMALSWAT